MVAILINQRVQNAVLKISRLPILIAKHGVLHRYLAISDKQFMYLVLAVFQPIVSYHTQFSFVSSAIYQCWDVLVRKDFKSKTGLS
ncbi:hypothetical protein G9A89_011301 [Geosiphon pyriformis]|nr:hypothetical protein G9A89_011301 [Geosiphon pyriformis]